MKQIETIIDRFGGMTKEKRQGCRFSQHFDNYTYEKMLIPLRTTEVDALTESTLDTLKIEKMTYAYDNLYGAGVIGNKPKVYMKTDGASMTSVWTDASGTPNSASSGNADGKLFVFFKNYLYGSDNANIWKYGPLTSTRSFTYNDYSTYQATAQGYVHEKANLLFVPSNNLLLQNSDSSDSAHWSVGLTMPFSSTSKTPCEYGDLLAIPVNMANGKAMVYLWDMSDDSDYAIIDKIDFGYGLIHHIENLGGILTVVMTPIASTASLFHKISFKYWTGNRVVVFDEWICDVSPTIYNDKQKFNDLFYFAIKATIDDNTFEGLARIFKKPDGSMVANLDMLPRNDTAIASSSGLKSFYRYGDFTFISYTTAAGAYTISRSDDVDTHVVTSIHDTQTFNAGDSSLKKALLGVTLTTDPMPQNGVIYLQYKKDNDSSWTTIFKYTDTTGGVISYSAVKADTDEDGTVDADFPKSYKEIRFRIKSYRGPKITALSFKEDIIGARPY